MFSRAFVVDVSDQHCCRQTPKKIVLGMDIYNQKREGRPHNFFVGLRAINNDFTMAILDAQAKRHLSRSVGRI